MKLPEPQKEHAWLQQLVGEWTSECEMPGEPGQPAMKLIGTETVRSLGSVWILAEGKADMPGGGIGHSLMTLGFDPEKGRFVGTWVGAMMTHLWPYDGELDPTEKMLTLNSVGPNFSAPGKTTNFKDIIELKDPNHRTLRGVMQHEEGAWKEMMTVHYRRR